MRYVSGDHLLLRHYKAIIGLHVLLYYYDNLPLNRSSSFTFCLCCFCFGGVPAAGIAVFSAIVSGVVSPGLTIMRGKDSHGCKVK